MPNAALLLSVSLLALSLSVFQPVKAARAEDAAPQGAARLAAANTAFACDLYAKLKQEPGNLVFSPFSISSALAMAYAGAGGKTVAAMAGALRWQGEQSALAPAYGELLRHLHAEAEKGGELHIANALWPDIRYPLREGYARLLEEHFASPVRPLDFEGRGEEARDIINAWTEEQTRGKITKMIDSSLEGKRLVLANALYFKGAWDAPFLKSLTREEPFALFGQKPVPVPLMKQQDHFRIYADKDVQVLELPFTGETSMCFILPVGKGERDLRRVEAGLSPAAIEKWRDSSVVAEVIVFLPRLSVASDGLFLTKALTDLGMGAAFAKDADFSGMSAEGPLFLDAVLHKAVVDIDETGAEAAAVTGIMTTASGAPGPRPQPVVFRADRPFLFLLRENSSGSILFMGRIEDPR